MHLLRESDKANVKFGLLQCTPSSVYRYYFRETDLAKTSLKQECIPVGCVPAAH